MRYKCLSRRVFELALWQYDITVTSCWYVTEVASWLAVLSFTVQYLRSHWQSSPPSSSIRERQVLL